MTVREALQLLSNVAARFPATRQDHVQLVQAEQTLRAFIEEYDTPAAPNPPEEKVASSEC